MSKPGSHPMDPRGLISEAYRIEGIGPEDCRSIFFDWAMGLAPGVDPGEAAAALRAHHEADAPGHPMTVLLDQAIARGSAGPDRKARPSARRRNRAGGAEV
ncbi:MAG: hypothetical protein AAF675_17980 [Pseudomonadota bacterium]